MTESWIPQSSHHVILEYLKQPLLYTSENLPRAAPRTMLIVKTEMSQIGTINLVWQKGHPKSIMSPDGHLYSTYPSLSVNWSHCVKVRKQFCLSPDHKICKAEVRQPEAFHTNMQLQEQSSGKSRKLTVSPQRSTGLTSTPCWSSNSTTGTWPSLAAKCKAVLPS